MLNITVRGLWRGLPVAEFFTVDLDSRLGPQQKQIARLLFERIEPETNADSGEDETPVDFATRLGFTKLDYQYQDGNPVFVDVLDPSKAI